MTETDEQALPVWGFRPLSIASGLAAVGEANSMENRTPPRKMEVEAAGQIWRLEPWMRRGRGVSVAVARARVKSSPFQLQSTAHHSQAKDGRQTNTIG
jgi:hypothetical protein